MKCVDIDYVELEMILAQSVHNHQGDLMLEVGTAITDKDIRVLKSWGVQKVWVRKDAKEADPEEESDTEENPSEAFSSDILEEKFSAVLDDPVMAEIMRVAKGIQERRYSK